MIRAVFDANVLVSYLLTHRLPIATLIDDYLARGAIVPVTAPELLEELERVLRYPKLQRYYTAEEASRFLALVMALSELVELPEPIPRICRDPDDDRLIACAVAGDAGVIVTGDDDLLVLERVSDISILCASDVMRHLAKQDNGDNQE